jgi:sulfate permease, SulP family
MTRVPVTSHRTLGQLMQVIGGLPQVHLPTLALAGATVVIILLLRDFAGLPGSLIVIAGAIAASAAFGFERHGIILMEGISGGLPALSLPHVGWQDAPPLFTIAGSCFLMIVAQSSATAYAYASRHRQTLDANADLMGLAVANATAALSGTFVVNGSPTQTAMMESAGGRSQIAHLAMAGVVAIVLLWLTAPLHYLPRCVLGAVVFTIGIGLIDIRSLRDIWRESPGEFELSLITAGVVIAIGVEQGILLAIVLSLLRHVRHSYRPHCAVLIGENGHWRPVPAVAGATSAPGLIIFQFGANLFYANAARFAADIQTLVQGAPAPVKWLVLDAGAITSVDYSAARTLRDLIQDLTRRHITLMLVHAESSLIADLQRHRLGDMIGPDQVFDTFRGALAAIDRQRH